MQNLSKLFSFTMVAALAVFSLPATPAEAASKYKCKVKGSNGNMSVTFKKGRAKSSGISFETKTLENGSVSLSFQGETAILNSDGTVTGRNGNTTGPHSCDMKEVRAHLKK